jgi:hypothetical protein
VPCVGSGGPDDSRSPGATGRHVTARAWGPADILRAAGWRPCAAACGAAWAEVDGRTIRLESEAAALLRVLAAERRVGQDGAALNHRERFRRRLAAHDPQRVQRPQRRGPLRRVVDVGLDVDRLECGHVVPRAGRVTVAARCEECRTEVRHG